MKTLKSMCLHKDTGFSQEDLTFTAANVLLGGVTILHHEVEVGHSRSLPPLVFRLTGLGRGRSRQRGSLAALGG